MRLFHQSIAYLSLLFAAVAVTALLLGPLVADVGPGNRSPHGTTFGRRYGSVISESRMLRRHSGIRGAG